MRGRPVQVVKANDEPQHTHIWLDGLYLLAYWQQPLTLSTGEGSQDRLGHPARRRPQDQNVGRAVVARYAQEINEFILRGNTGVVACI